MSYRPLRRQPFTTGPDPASPPACQRCGATLTRRADLCPPCLSDDYPALRLSGTYGEGARCVNCRQALTFAGWEDQAAGVYVCGPCRAFTAPVWIEGP